MASGGATVARDARWLHDGQVLGRAARAQPAGHDRVTHLGTFAEEG